MGFEEIPHTADWSVRVWAPDLPGLLSESARAMNTLAGVVTAAQPRLERSLQLAAPDGESLLVGLLSELIYLQELEHLAFSDFSISLQGANAAIDMHGFPITSLDKAIKAVTWHNLRIEHTARGLEVVIVFDV
jgi:SHS2 domain-containing protein